MSEGQKAIREERNLMATITEKQKKFTHFSYGERFVLGSFLKGTDYFPKITNTERLADILHKSRRSIQREIRRGTVEHETSSSKTKLEYNADHEQGKAVFEMSAKGAR